MKINNTFLQKIFFTGIKKTLFISAFNTLLIIAMNKEEAVSSNDNTHRIINSKKINKYIYNKTLMVGSLVNKIPSQEIFNKIYSYNISDKFIKTINNREILAQRLSLKQIKALTIDSMFALYKNNVIEHLNQTQLTALSGNLKQKKKNTIKVMENNSYPSIK
jgi:hypothetical protein